MGQNIKQSYLFSFFTALWITLFLIIGLALLEFIFFSINWFSLLVAAVFVFVFAFLIIQYRSEKFIYRKIRQLYESVSLLASSSIEEEQVTTNMEELTQNIEQFAERKKVEIEALKIRENYRRDFIGNISHELKTPLFTVEGYLLTL